MTKSVAKLIKRSIVGLLCLKLIYDYVIGSGLLDAITNVESKIDQVFTIGF